MVLRLQHHHIVQVIPHRSHLPHLVPTHLDLGPRLEREAARAHMLAHGRLDQYRLSSSFHTVHTCPNRESPHTWILAHALNARLLVPRCLRTLANIFCSFLSASFMLLPMRDRTSDAEQPGWKHTSLGSRPTCSGNGGQTAEQVRGDRRYSCCYVCQLPNAPLPSLATRPLHRRCSCSGAAIMRPSSRQTPPPHPLQPHHQQLLVHSVTELQELPETPPAAEKCEESVKVVGQPMRA